MNIKRGIVAGDSTYGQRIQIPSMDTLTYVKTTRYDMGTFTICLTQLQPRRCKQIHGYRHIRIVVAATFVPMNSPLPRLWGV